MIAILSYLFVHSNSLGFFRKDAKIMPQRYMYFFKNIFQIVNGHNSTKTLMQRQILSYGLTLFLVGIRNHTQSIMGNEMTYPFPNFNSCTIEVWQGINNSMPHFIMEVMTYPWWD